MSQLQVDESEVGRHVNVTPSPPTELSTDPEKPIETNDGDRPHYPKWRWITALVGLYLGALLYGLDTTIAADVQTAVYEDFGQIEQLAWVGIGFPMGSVACILLVGRVYDSFNVKTLLNCSIFLFEVGSAVCGSAPSMNALIVGRVIAGLGGCGMYIGALTFLSSLGSPSKLFLYNALIGASWGTGAILGPVVGGAFSVSSATWRWAFYINLPLAALFTPVYFLVTPSYDPRPDLTFRQKLGTVDWVGAFLNAGTFAILITALAFCGSTFAWGSATSIALWVVWAIFFIAYVVQQGFALLTTRQKQIFPVHFLKDPQMVLVYFATSAAATAGGVTLYYIPLYFAFTRGDTALQAAVRLLPYICVFIFFIMFAGATLPVSGRALPYYTVGGILIVTGGALMFTVRVDTSAAKIYGYEVLLAAGSGLAFQNGYAVVSARVGSQDKSNGIGFVNVSQIGTTALALAIASSLYQNLGFHFLKNALSEFDFSDGFLRAALGGAGSAALASAPGNAIELAVASVAYTISRVFGMVVAAGALLLVSSFFMNRKKVDFAKAIAGGG